MDTSVIQVARAGEDGSRSGRATDAAGSAGRATPPDRLAALRPRQQGGGLQGGRGGIQGEPIPLDTENPDYQEYFNKKIRPPVYHHWVYPESAVRQNQSGSLILVFGLNPDGSLKYLKVETPSRHAVLDEAIELAVKLAQPFPELPPDLRARHPTGLLIRVDVRYTLERRVESWLGKPSR